MENNKLNNEQMKALNTWLSQLREDKQAIKEAELIRKRIRATEKKVKALLIDNDIYHLELPEDIIDIQIEIKDKLDEDKVMEILEHISDYDSVDMNELFKPKQSARMKIRKPLPKDESEIIVND